MANILTPLLLVSTCVTGLFPFLLPLVGASKEHCDEIFPDYVVLCEVNFFSDNSCSLVCFFS